ncbi:acetate--CoA ligase family protein, partial [Campylobacter jejuni]
RVRADCRRELNTAEIRALLALFYVPLRDMPVDVAAAEPESRPMAIRVRRDPQFGPVIRFGAGGPDAVLSQSDRGI